MEKTCLKPPTDQMNIPPDLEIFHMTLDLLLAATSPQPGPLQFEELPGPQPRPNG
jgi:hypothetical protein